jgi:NADPH:quinone reductase-like Zn-dependent oxidoreductase
MTSVSLNYRDLVIATRSPLYPGTHKANLVPCTDGAGVIHAAGAGSAWAGKEGERVLLHPNEWLSGDARNLEGKFGVGSAEYDGFLQEWVVIADERVIRAPGHLTAVENSALVTAGVTAWSAIREGLDMVLTGEMREWRDGKRLEGKTILTQGTGGVSCFAIQIAAALGATVIVTSSSDEKLALAKELGATHGINYKTHPDWDVEVKRLTNGAGVDHVIELGGAQTLMKSVASVRVGGLISVIGILSAPQDIPGQIIPALLFGGITVKGCVAFSRDATADFAKFVEQHGIKPVVAKVFEYQDATAAFEAMQKQTEVGKIVIKVSDE